MYAVVERMSSEFVCSNILALSGVLCSLLRTVYFLLDPSQTMVPLMHKLFKIFRLNVKRHMVWEGTSNFRLMAAYDMETGCK